MKKIIKALSLFLTFIMLFSALASCASEMEEENSDSSYSDDTTSESEEYDDYGGNFPIFKDGKYIARVVMPDIPSDTEKEVYAKLRTAIANITKVKVESQTDYLKEGESHDKNEYVILVGETNYVESKWIYGKTNASS